MNKGIDVIVTGGRDYADAEMVKSILDLFDIGLIIQGGASGADNLAMKYAYDNHIGLVEVQADWDKHGKAAGPIRNKAMLELYPAAIVIAFPGGAGTANCVRQAIERDHLVMMVK